MALFPVQIRTKRRPKCGLSAISAPGCPNRETKLSAGFVQHPRLGPARHTVHSGTNGPGGTLVESE